MSRRILQPTHREMMKIILQTLVLGSCLFLIIFLIIPDRLILSIKKNFVCCDRAVENLTLLSQEPSFMCTGIRLTSKNGAVFYGRTMEFGKKTESSVLIIPRNYSFIGSTPFENKTGLQWKSNYAVVGANVSGALQFVDGVNEEGLAGGLFYFSECAEYQDVTLSDAAYSLAPSELITWILTSFATVEQVKQAIGTIKISKTLFKPWNIIPPIHAIVHDKAGNSIVLEYVKGKLNLYDNQLGVITNSPSFDWHLTNLKNYSILFAQARQKLKQCAGVEVTQSKGSGSLGLPGDFSSTSRFVRAAFFSQTIEPPSTNEETRDVIFHLLNLFDIPIGGERLNTNCLTTYDYTQWTSVCDLSNKKFYFHTYENRQLRCVDLMKCDLNASEPIVISMKSKQQIIDCTPNIKEH